MKECPDCEAKNQPTNLFCPLCGYSFLDEPDSPPVGLVREERPAKKSRFTAIAVVAVIILGLAAGLVSFFVSREIELGRLVSVEAGTVWKCGKCGRVYKNRVVTFDVPKSERDNYQVETVEGECYSCRYGPMVGFYQDYLERFSRKGYFLGFNAEMEVASAAYMSQHQDLFPARDLSGVEGLAKEVDPRLLQRDFADFAGKPVRVRGRVISSETLTSEGDGAKLTYLLLSPIHEGREYDLMFPVIYRGASPLLMGDTADCRVLPVDLVRRSGGGGESLAVLSIAMFVSGGPSGER